MANDSPYHNAAPRWPAGLDPDTVEDALKSVWTRPGAIDRAVRDELVEVMPSRGDDGLLEYLRDLRDAPRPGVRHRDIGRREAVATLATSLEGRALYKRIAFQRHTRQDPMDFYDEHGGPDARRQIERRAARFAGVSPAWHILVWLPYPGSGCLAQYPKGLTLALICPIETTDGRHRL